MTKAASRPDPFPVPHVTRRCIASGTNAGDTVLDPFGGSMTVKRVAESMGRRAICITLPLANTNGC